MVKKVFDILPPPKKTIEKEERRPETEREERIEVKRNVKPKITYVPQKTARREEIREEKPKSSPALVLLTRVSIVLAIIFAAFFFLDYKLARARITIWPQTDNLKVEETVTVDPSSKTTDFPNKMIPGSTITAEKSYSGEFPATGKKSTENKAQGMVKIYNNFTSTQRLIKGTRLQAPLEKFQPALSKDEAPWFRTLDDAVLAAKSSKDVRVVADGPGEKYNIDPSIFSVPGLVGTPQYTFIYGQSFEKFKGGDQREMFEIKQEDLDKAKEAMKNKAAEEIKRELAIMVPQGFIMIPETAKVDILELAPAMPAGAVTDKFGYQIKVKATAVVFNKADMDNFARDGISNKISNGQKVCEDSLKVSYSFAVPAGGAAASKITLQTQAEIETYLPINESDLKKALAEKKDSEARFFLMNQPKIKDVDIDSSPFWRSSIPKNLEQIEVGLSFD